MEWFAGGHSGCGCRHNQLLYPNRPEPRAHLPIYCQRRLRHECIFRWVLMPILGLIFHYFISTSWTLLFFLLYPKINWLGKSWIISGLGYGVFVWLAMNLVVLKLSRVPQFPFNPTQAAIGMGILMLAVGLPISFLAQRYYSGGEFEI